MRWLLHIPVQLGLLVIHLVISIFEAEQLTVFLMWVISAVLLGFITQLYVVTCND